MKILVACEFSGAVRSKLREAGHDAWSCDLEPAEDKSPHHLREDVLNVIHWNDWDMLIAFPPCTHLAVSGARWFPEKRLDGRQQNAIDFFMALVNCDIPLKAIENPIGIMSTKYRKPDQIIQPYQFGHDETKATCLWLEGLPPLVPTKVIPGPHETRIHDGCGFAWNSDECKRERSRTYDGIAQAMCDQWGSFMTLREWI